MGSGFLILVRNFSAKLSKRSPTRHKRGFSISTLEKTRRMRRPRVTLLGKKLSTCTLRSSSIGFAYTRPEISRGRYVVLDGSRPRLYVGKRPRTRAPADSEYRFIMAASCRAVSPLAELPLKSPAAGRTMFFDLPSQISGV